MARKARVRMPSATSIVARSAEDHIIGIENRLPWHLGTDLKLFKEQTSEHAIIMGRKTYESIGRPLPKRLNIVLSRSFIQEQSNLLWASSVETALLLADVYSICNFKKEFFVIGGENVYSLFDRYINRVILTEVNCGRINGDAKFDREFDSREWNLLKERCYHRGEVDDFDFSVKFFARLKPFHRYLSKRSFFEKAAISEKQWDLFSDYMSALEQLEKILPQEQLEFFELTELPSVCGAR